MLGENDGEPDPKVALALDDFGVFFDDLPIKTVGLSDVDNWADGFIEGWEEGSCETEGFNEGMAEAGTLDLDDFEFGSFFYDLLMVGS